MAFLTSRLIDTPTTRFLPRKSYTETVKGELPPATVCENDENPQVEEDVSSDETKEHPSSNESEACFSARNLFKGGNRYELDVTPLCIWAVTITMPLSSFATTGGLSQRIPHYTFFGKQRCLRESKSSNGQRMVGTL